MTLTPFEHREGEWLLQATANGKASATVYLYRVGDAELSGTLVHSHVFNPSNAKARAAFANDASTEAGDDVRLVVTRLCQSIGAQIDQARTTAPVSEKTESVRVAPLEEPWGTPVRGGDLLNAICDKVRTHLVLPPHSTDTVALWTAHTYVTDVTDYSPYLLITSPTRECGKSTLLDLLEHLAYRASLTGGITASALYRRIDRFAGRITMLLDEIDTRLRGDGAETLRGVLNTGFHRNGRVTISVAKGDNFEERDFVTFCAKALAGIGRPWDTVTSRSIPIRIERASPEELARIRKIRGDSIRSECEGLRRQLVRWSMDTAQQLRNQEPQVPSELGARQADVWRPILSIAELAGRDWPERARHAALALYGVAEDEGDHGLLLLQDVRDLLGTRSTILTEEITTALGQREDRPWSEYGRLGKSISARVVATLLGRFDVKPSTVRVGDTTGKGYHLDRLAPAFHRYIKQPTTPVQNVTSVTLESATQRPGGPPVQNVTSVTPHEHVTDVTDGIGDVTDARTQNVTLAPGIIVDGQGTQTLTPERRAELFARRRSRQTPGGRSDRA
jgi:hypothetical protein